jgi:outer membrane protein
MKDRVGFAVAALVGLTLCLPGPCLGAGTDEPLRLDIDTCVSMAIEANVSVRQAAYDLDQSRYSVLGSASGLLPSAGWSSTHSRSQVPSLVGDKLEASVKSYSSTFSLRETASAGTFFGLLESVAYKHASEQSLRAAKHEAAYLARQKYLEVLKTKRLLGVSEEALDLGKRRLEKAQALLDVGSGVKSDVLRAQVEVGNNELGLISARNALRLAEIDLKYFLGITDDRALDLEDILETGEAAGSLEGALAEAMEQRPDIRAGSDVVAARRRAVWREAGGWLPTFQFSWRKQYVAPEEKPEFPTRLADLWDDATWGWSLSASVSIFDGLATFSGVKSAGSLLGSAKEGLKQTRRDASLEVTRAFYNVEEARQRVKVSKETVSLAEEELRLAEEKYRLGGGTMLEQIDAQVSLSQARTSNIQALYDYMLSQADLVRAAGQD